MLLLRGFAHKANSIRGVCGTNTKAYPVQVSDQRGVELA